MHSPSIRMALIPGRVVMCHMPSAGVTMAGMNVAGAVGEYVVPTVVIIVGPTNACCN